VFWKLGVLCSATSKSDSHWSLDLSVIVTLSFRSIYESPIRAQFLVQTNRTILSRVLVIHHIFIFPQSSQNQ
jgi:hypothetical protein